MSRDSENSVDSQIGWKIQTFGSVVAGQKMKVCVWYAINTFQKDRQAK